ncbi:hypothetical protein GCM10017600_70790 [Streptosporangium carneum]|uniref:Uncharacterized protein n=1 Tax=Streptosporangium carneum TaxID=47481 RepID=A0A9W6I8P4_9ACTN|nr:hypothetical protein GCM10017600_70790 [Streptosporangium carneum]
MSGAAPKGRKETRGSDRTGAGRTSGEAGGGEGGPLGAERADPREGQDGGGAGRGKVDSVT